MCGPVECGVSRLRDHAFGAACGTVPAAADPLGRWLRAVALGGRGRYAAAAAELAALHRDPRAPVTVLAHAAITRASHLRQMGGHSVARPLDALGLRLAEAAIRVDPGPAAGADPDAADAAGARADALVGLAADALGCGDLAAAHRLLAVARTTVDAHPSWRPRTRWGWVAAELALVEGRAAAAVAPAAAAVAAASDARRGAVRHEIKSRIVLAVARAAAGDGPADAALAELDDLADASAARDLLPLRWPAELAAADLATAGGDARQGGPGGPDTPAGRGAGSVAGRANGAARRRHAARTALSALYSSADPLGKRQMGESVWVPVEVTVL